MDDLDQQAADALTIGDLAAYQALRAARPEADWRGHDRRAARLQGLPLGPDPLLQPYLRRGLLSGRDDQMATFQRGR